MVISYLQPDSFNCVTAEYALKDRPTFLGWSIDVSNRYILDSGEPQPNGDLCARTPDASEPAKLQVAPCFLPSFLGGPYWIIAHNEAEGYALISGGQPTIQGENGCKTGTGTNDSGLWIFTREVVPADHPGREWVQDGHWDERFG